jgi:hypothetical protein
MSSSSVRHKTLPILLVLLLGSVGALAQQREATTIPVPRQGYARVNLSNGPMRIDAVTLKNRPSDRDIREARRDPDDMSTLAWVFQVSNAGRRDWHARIRVNVLDANGEILVSNDREGEVNARDFHDRITVFMRIRTLDYLRADRVQIEADFYPD